MILEISDLGVVVDAFSLEISDFGLEVSDLGVVADAFGLEVSDLGLEVSDLGVVVSDLGVVVDAFGLETSDLGIFFRHPTLQPLHHLLHCESLLQEAPACLIPIGGHLSGLFLFGVFRGFPQSDLSSVDVVWF